MISDGKNSVVTGASSGIGRAIALALGSIGGAVGLIGRNARRLSNVTEEVRGQASRVKGYQADLASDEDIQRIATQLREDFEALDVLVHSAGIFRMGTLADSPASDLDLLYRTNVRGPYALTQAVLPMLVARKGQIV
ncbi:MAG: SDR family oxidoreductase, partial [Candidatus Acidiferrum sp.]